MQEHSMTDGGMVEARDTLVRPRTNHQQVRVTGVLNEHPNRIASPDLAAHTDARVGFPEQLEIVRAELGIGRARLVHGAMP
jgi:hypothetical protein